ncbi:MAG: hypothetical protein AB7N76_24520 [Planctomycetota bacterium]
MGRDSKGEGRQEEARRRFQQGSGRKAAQLREAREAMAAELSDPARFAACLRTFSQLALVLAPLAPCRLPHDELVERLLAAGERGPGEPGLGATGSGAAGPEHAQALRREIASALAGEPLVHGCAAAIQQALGEVVDREALLALTAAGALCTSCLDEQARPDHPLFELLFEVTLTDALISGLFLVRLVQRGLDPQGAGAGAAFAKALAAGERQRELDALGVVADAAALARAYAEVVRDGQRRAGAAPRYHLQPDAVLHLLHAHARLAVEIGGRIAREGWSGALRGEYLNGYEAAYARDVDEDLSRELARWCKHRLERLRDDPAALELAPEELEPERLRCAATWLSLLELPRERSPLLRAIHVESLVLARAGVSDELERLIATKLWADPDDGYSLGEYERFLSAKGDATRARRVARYRAWVAEERRAQAGGAP